MTLSRSPAEQPGTRAAHVCYPAYTGAGPQDAEHIHEREQQRQRQPVHQVCDPAPGMCPQAQLERHSKGQRYEHCCADA